MDLSKFKNVLVFRVGHLGDTLVALPAFWAIRSVLPDARLTLLTNLDIENPGYITPRDVLPATGLFDDWMNYPSKRAGSSDLKVAASLAIQIRRHGFDALFYLISSERTARQVKRDIAFFRLAGIKKIFGTAYFLKSRRGEKNGNTVSESEFLFDNLVFDGFPVDRATWKPEMALTDNEHEKAAKWLLKHRDRIGDRRLIAVGPGGKKPSHVWEEERFAYAVRDLIEQQNAFPIVFGGPEDAEKAKRLLSYWGVGANAAGKFSIRGSAALLEKCELYVGNDTGTMHLAASAGTPCVAIFSAAAPAGQWYPSGDNHLVIRKNVDCQGCRLEVCPKQNKCLDLVGVDEVVAACREHLARSDNSGQQSV